MQTVIGLGDKLLFFKAFLLHIKDIRILLINYIKTGNLAVAKQGAICSDAESIWPY